MPHTTPAMIASMLKEDLEKLERLEARADKAMRDEQFGDAARLHAACADAANHVVFLVTGKSHCSEYEGMLKQLVRRTCSAAAKAASAAELCHAGEMDDWLDAIVITGDAWANAHTGIVRAQNQLAGRL